MTLIKSISGIRGTIGGKAGENLTPLDVVKFTSAFGHWLKQNRNGQELKVVVGRDARISGPIVDHLVCATLQSLGINVVNLGLSTTPTVEVAVPSENALGGIILTASHNPAQWNALKLLNSSGEFISGDAGAEVLSLAESGEIMFSEVDVLGSLEVNDTYLSKHIDDIINLDLVNVEAIRKSGLKVAVDAVNSTGGIFVPMLLEKLGVKEIYPLFCEPHGRFPHNPEPLPENLTEIAKTVTANNADIGIVVDPDVDRLALVTEKGEMFGEEYTLVAVADYVLKHKKGSTVSNLSSSRALRDVAEKHGQSHFAAAVGEVNVVNKMKEVNAVIGGEGNGGIIFPAYHYGRDALVGIALFLSHLATSGLKTSELRNSYPKYVISKNKIELTPDLDVDGILKSVLEKYKNEEINSIDGVKIDFEKEWVHLRKSNTEPIIRIYAESSSESGANDLALRMISEIKDLAGLQ